MEAKGFAEAALDAIAVDGGADGSRDGEAQAGTGRGVRSGNIRLLARQAEGREEGTGDAETMVINESKVGGAKDPAGAREQPRGAILLWRTGRLFRR